MGDSFTNYLLITLIGLVAWLGRAAYEKINEIYKMIQQIFVSHQKYESDIEQLKRNQVDHETRMRDTEKQLAKIQQELEQKNY